MYLVKIYKLLQRKYSMSRKYVLCPGYVRSQFDSDEHYINKRQLADLYGVKLEDCMLETDRGRTDDSAIYLRPRYKGDYLEWLRDNES